MERSEEYQEKLSTRDEARRRGEHTRGRFRELREQGGRDPEEVLRKLARTQGNHEEGISREELCRIAKRLAKDTRSQGTGYLFNIDFARYPDGYIYPSAYLRGEIIPSVFRDNRWDELGIYPTPFNRRGRGINFNSSGGDL